MAQKDKDVSTLTRGIGGLFKKNKVNYVKGYGKFISPSEVSVDTIDDGNTVVKGKNIIIATGSDFKSLPGSLPLMKRKLYLLLVLRLCNRFQRNLWSLGQAILDMRWAQCGPGMQKMKFMLKTKVVGVDTSGDGVKLTVEPASGGDQTTLEADVVLVSAGRTPFTAGLGLDKIGVETDKGGRILVNERVSQDKETDKILGVHIMAPNAGELIHEAVLALAYDAASEDIARVCHARPTMSEALKEAAMATHDKPIHI
ncbi:hypothetical protein OIU78_005110 [Salix suchowensis]|nr:hypothetical protein OIU78_005110 [Salix suchowensis]